MSKTQIHHVLPDGIIPINPQSRDWKFNIAAGVALYPVETVVTNDDGEQERSTSLVERDTLTTLTDAELDYFGIPIEPGMTIITAPTAVGKTQMALNLGSTLAKQGLNVGWITLNEPAKYSSFMNTDEDVRRALHDQAVLPDVLIIDSFRLLQFSVSGTTRSGGVSSGLFEMLTELNNAAEAVGVMVVGLFNPLSADASSQAVFNQELASSVHQIVELSSYDAGTYRTRSGDRKPRQFQTSNAASISEPVGAVTVSVGPTESPFNPTQAIFGR